MRSMWMAMAIAVCVTLSARPHGQSAVAGASAGINADAVNEANALLDAFVRDRKVAGAVAAVARHGQLVSMHATGVQDLATNTPMTERSLFRIYSMTKSVTAVAVMMLTEEGRLRLDEPVQKFIPDFARVVVANGATTRPPSRPITIEDLLIHTSGLNHRTSDEYRQARVRDRSMTLPTFVANVVRVPLMEDPGTRYRYSEATTVLGRVVEVISGKPLDQFFSERIFAPLKMVDTGFVARPDQRTRLTTVYAPAEGGGLRPVEIESVPFTEKPALLEGAVGLLSTVPDFLRFSQMLLNHGTLDGVRLLKPETVRMMVTNRLPEAITRDRGGVMGWGLANVNVVLDPARVPYPALAGEYGWDGTAGTIFWVDPTRGLITILMTQSSPANPDRIRQQFKTLVEKAVIP
jgi:CubicO group peptidase (beta-lactamase class C family)